MPPGSQQGCMSESGSKAAAVQSLRRIILPVRSKRLIDAKVAGRSCGENAESEDDPRRHDLFLGEDGGCADEEPEAYFCDPPELAGRRLAEHGEADEEDEEEGDTVEDGGGFLFRPTEHGGTERGEEGEDSSEVEDF